MFEHIHHQKIHRILSSLNAAIFEEVGAYFGGGTLIALLNDEYRWSKDIDFMCPVGSGYRRLRELVSANHFKPAFFFSKTDNLQFPREITANQYGIRFLVLADSTPIKFEIVAEARVALNPPKQLPWLNLPCLDFNDQCTEKLLANADRWPDTGVQSRDLIDLAMLRINGTFPQEAITKAENAYSVIPELTKALIKFQSDHEYRNKCFTALEIESRSKILHGIDLLAEDLGLEKTKRHPLEL